MIQLWMPGVAGVAGMSLVSFFIYGADKRLAIRGKRRIPERTLLLCSLFGAPGALMGMWLFRHKIRKPLFRALVPLMLVLDVAVLLAVGR